MNEKELNGFFEYLHTAYGVCAGYRLTDDHDVMYVTCDSKSGDIGIMAQQELMRKYPDKRWIYADDKAIQYMADELDCFYKDAVWIGFIDPTGEGTLDP